MTPYSFSELGALCAFARAKLRMLSPAKTPSTQRPLTQPFFLRSPYLDFFELGALCAFAGANLRTHSPAKHVLSNVEGTPSSQRPLRPTVFFFAAPTLIFPNLATPSTALTACFASLREANSSPFSRSKYAMTETCYLLTRTMQRSPDDTLKYRWAGACALPDDSAGNSSARTNATRLS